MTAREPRRRAIVHVESPYLLEPEAAGYLRVSESTLRHWRADGLQKGPRFRYHGGVVVYEISDLERWSSARAATSTTKPAEDVAATSGQPQH